MAAPADGSRSAIAPETLTVGGRQCSRITVVNSTDVVCHDVSARSWSSGSVEIVLQGQSYAAPTMVTVVNQPQVTGVDPPNVPTAGGANLTIYGVAFGTLQGDVDAVLIGGRPCSPLWHISGSQVKCATPPGVGRGIDVVVTNRLGLSSSPAPLLNYDGPQVTSVSPSYALTAPENSPRVNVTVFGTSIASGDARDAVPVVSVGGVRCPVIHRLSASAVQCQGLDASRWSAADVEVVLAG